MVDTNKPSGRDGAKAVADSLRHGAKQPSEIVKVNHSSEVATPMAFGKVMGFEDLPGSIIRIPYYRMVHPNSRGTELEDGTRASAGQFITDMGEAVDNIRAAIIRTKTDKINQEVKENGVYVTKIKPIIRILAVDTKTLTPFQLNITKGSFYNMGDLVMWFNKKGCRNSFEYPVIISGDYVESGDNPYWAVKFTGENQAFGEEELDIMKEVAMKYASVLDHDVEDEETPARPAQPVKKYNPDGSVIPTDSAGNVIEDIPGTGDGEGMPF